MRTFGNHAPAHTNTHILGGDHHHFEFPNGYGASVIPERDMSARLDIWQGQVNLPVVEGRWELAVIGPDGRLDYGTPVTNDVERWRTPDEIAALLDQIASLPKAVVA